MIRSPTVFVLGAGANADFKMPLGTQLTERISRLLDMYFDGSRLTRGDVHIFRAISAIAQHDQSWRNNTLLSSGRHIASAMLLARSIDTFLETFADDRERVLLGKLGIARAISDYERTSVVYIASQSDRAAQVVRAASGSWYVALAQLLFSGVPRQSIDQIFKETTFIDFNYDRVLPHFLVAALQVYFSLTEAEAWEIYGTARVFNPYGSLGRLRPGMPDHVEFGPENPNLQTMAERIVTFSERVDHSGMRDLMQKEIIVAERLMFLGFGFHQQNIDLLAPRPGDLKEPKRVFATAPGVLKSDAELIHRKLTEAFLPGAFRSVADAQVKLYDGKCTDFFSSHAYTLMD